MSEEMFPPDLPQYSSEGYGKSPTLVQLGYIFLYIAGGLDFIGVPIFVAYIFLFPMILKAAPGGGPPPPPFLPGVLSVMYGVFAVVSLLQGILKMIAATKLRKHSRHAWGWGLAAAIASCTQIQCSLFCVLPLAMGVYLLVILCRPQVQAYLRAGPESA